DRGRRRDLEVRPWWRSGGGSDLEVVERQLGFPVVDRQKLMTGTGERFGIGPREERTSVDGPVDRAASPGDREVVAAVLVDVGVGPARLASGAVLLLPADDGQRVVPAAEDEDVPRRRVAAPVLVEGFAVAEELELDVAGRALR